MDQFFKIMADERQQNKKTLESDIEYGKRREKECLQPIIDYFNFQDLKQTKKEFSLYDYYCLGVRIELKSRRVNKTRFETTFIGKNKVDYAYKNRKDIKSYFVFDFLDGLYYIKYKSDLFKTFTVSIQGRTDRGKDELKEYYEIPVDLLKKM